MTPSLQRLRELAEYIENGDFLGHGAKDAELLLGIADRLDRLERVAEASRKVCDWYGSEASPELDEDLTLTVVASELIVALAALDSEDSDGP